GAEGVSGGRRRQAWRVADGQVGTAPLRRAHGDLGVERRSPPEGGGAEVDVGVIAPVPLVHFHQAKAVTAGEEVPLPQASVSGDKTVGRSAARRCEPRDGQGATDEGSAARAGGW